MSSDTYVALANIWWIMIARVVALWAFPAYDPQFWSRITQITENGPSHSGFNSSSDCACDGCPCFIDFSYALQPFIGARLSCQTLGTWSKDKTRDPESILPDSLFLYRACVAGLEDVISPTSS